MNIGALCAALIIRRTATLREMQTCYSYQDALDMAEALQVADYNQWILSEELRKQHGH